MPIIAAAIRSLLQHPRKTSQIVCGLPDALRVRDNPNS